MRALRNAVLRETADRPGRASWRALVYRAVEGDERMLQYLSELSPDSKRADMGSLVFCGCLGTLRADPRMLAVLSRFGFPRP